MEGKIRSVYFPLLLITLFGAIGCGPKKQPSRFVHLNGKAQHILDTGTGQPVVVFITGFGDNLDAYRKIQEAISKVTRTIAYDRAGLGRSELTTKNRSLDSLVEELNQILLQEKIPPPYILVGHSYGGHIARYFAYAFPETIAGIVLIDPSVEYLDDEFRRLKSSADIESYDSLYKNGRDPLWTEGVRREADYFRSNAMLLKSKGVTFPHHVSVTVITALNMPESRLAFLKGVNQMKLDLHKKWATQFPNIRHVLAEKSGHYVHYDEPELVITEIKSMLKNNH